MKTFVKSFLTNESGATAIEYGLLAAVIALVAVVGMRTLGTRLSTLFTNIGTTLANPSN